MKCCPYCGSQLFDGAKFCTECGAGMPAPEPQEPPVREIPAAPSAAEPPVYRPQAIATDGEQPKARPSGKKKKGPRIVGIVLLVVLAVVVLCMLLGGEDPAEGRYEAVSAETDGGSVSVDGDWVELKSRGKATLSVMGSEYAAKWSTDGERITLKQSGDTYTGDLRNGVLTVDLAGISYTFVKEGAGPVTYKAVTCISGGQILDEELMDLIGGCYLVLNADASGKLYLFGEEMPITYTDTAITLDGEALTYTWKGETMVLTFTDGSSFDLVVTDEDPDAAVMSEFDWETGEWEETDMETEILSYLEWPGQVFSQMDLTNGSLSLRGGWGEGTVWFQLDEAGNSLVESISLYISDLDFLSLQALLADRYGEPTEEGEEPYAEANGGAVTYCWFEHPAGSLQLSMGSEQDFSVITFTAQ